MSSLLNLLRRLFAAAHPTPDPDRMSLNDWADLPAWHPRTDCAPR